jgi:hypothetical protein
LMKAHPHQSSRENRLSNQASYWQLDEGSYVVFSRCFVVFI